MYHKVHCGDIIIVHDYIVPFGFAETCFGLQILLKSILCHCFSLYLRKICAKVQKKSDIHKDSTQKTLRELIFHPTPPKKVTGKVTGKVTDKTPNKLLRLIVANPSITLERIKDVTVNVTVNCIIE